MSIALPDSPERDQEIKNLLIELDCYLHLITENKDLKPEVIYALKAISEILKRL